MSLLLTVRASRKRDVMFVDRRRHLEPPDLTDDVSTRDAGVSFVHEIVIIASSLNMPSYAWRAAGTFHRLTPRRCGTTFSHGG